MDDDNEDDTTNKNYYERYWNKTLKIRYEFKSARVKIYTAGHLPKKTQSEVIRGEVIALPIPSNLRMRSMKRPPFVESSPRLSIPSFFEERPY